MTRRESCEKHLHFLLLEEKKKLTRSLLNNEKQIST